MSVGVVREDPPYLVPLLDSPPKDERGIKMKVFNSRKPTNDVVRGILESYYIHDQKPETLKLAPFQVRILNTMFKPVARVPGSTHIQLPGRTYTYSTIKKSGKTEVGAAVLYNYADVFGGLCLSIANDKDQSTRNAFHRVYRMIRRMEKHDPELFHQKIASYKSDEIVFWPDESRPNGPEATIRAIPCDPTGEAGHENLAFTLWDELWGYKGDDAWNLWSELQPIPNIPFSCRFITTYAGFYGQSELLYEVYDSLVQPDPDGVPQGKLHPAFEGYALKATELGHTVFPVYQNGSTIGYWDEYPRMPWQTQQFLQDAWDDPEVRKYPANYKRLWRNQWQTGNEAFLTQELVEKAIELGNHYGTYNAHA